MSKIVTLLKEEQDKIDALIKKLSPEDYEEYCKINYAIKMLKTVQNF